MLVKGSKLVLKKSLPGLEDKVQKGVSAKVAEVQANGLLITVPGIGYGYFTYGEAENYFAEEPEHSWTPWKQKFDLVICEYPIRAIARNNGKRTEVLVKDNEGKSYKGVASCCEEDTFDEEVGLWLAFSRALLKYTEGELA